MTVSTSDLSVLKEAAHDAFDNNNPISGYALAAIYDDIAYRMNMPGWMEAMADGGAIEFASKEASK